MIRGDRGRRRDAARSPPSTSGWTFGGALTLDDAADVLEASQALALPPNGVVDFGGLTHADSSALAVMIALKRRAAAEGRTLTLDRPAARRCVRSRVVYGVEQSAGGSSARRRQHPAMRPLRHD